MCFAALERHGQRIKGSYESPSAQQWLDHTWITVLSSGHPSSKKDMDKQQEAQWRTKGWPRGYSSWGSQTCLNWWRRDVGWSSSSQWLPDEQFDNDDIAKIFSPGGYWNTVTGHPEGLWILHQDLAGQSHSCPDPALVIILLCRGRRLDQVISRGPFLAMLLQLCDSSSSSKGQEKIKIKIA